MPRQIVRDLSRPEKIRPQAKPTDTYYRPAEDTVTKPNADPANIQALADALTGVRPVVREVADRAHKEMVEENLRKGAEARDRNRRTFAQAVRDGLIPEGANPWFVKGYMQQEGRASAAMYEAALNDAWAKSDIKDQDDPAAYQKFVEDFRAQWMSEQQGETAHPDWFDGFTPIKDRAENNLSAHHLAYRQKEIKRKAIDGLYRETTAEVNNLVGQLSNPFLEAEDRTAQVQTLGTTLAQRAAEWVKNGMSGKDANETIGAAIIQAAWEQKDARVMDVLDHVTTPGGAVGGIKAIREARAQMESQILAYQDGRLRMQWAIEDRPHTLWAQEQAKKNAEWAEEQHARARAENRRVDEARAETGRMISEVALDPAQPLDPKRLAALAKLDPSAPSAVEHYRQYRLTAGRAVPTDRDVVRDILSDINEDVDAFDVSRIFKGVGVHYEEQMMFTLYNQYKTAKDAENKYGLKKDVFFQETLLDLKAGVRGNEANLTPDKLENSNSAGIDLRLAYMAWLDENPNATPTQKAKFLRENRRALMKEYAKEGRDMPRDEQREREAEAAEEAALEAQRLGPAGKWTPAMREELKRLRSERTTAVLNVFNAPFNPGTKAGLLTTVHRLRGLGHSVPPDIAIEALVRAVQQRNWQAVEDFYTDYPDMRP